MDKMQARMGLAQPGQTAAEGTRRVCILKWDLGSRGRITLSRLPQPPGMRLPQAQIFRPECKLFYKIPTSPGPLTDP
ncbi:hypothetical protein X474_02770 [Dethiosulfatarculus sandiegensis]|uniref:Uncharacterized protein n=1 Tax=Dethiosulfatarculus sandiegensis TaxID=1429043 RepID=A0A0D2JJ69_9BACT|nr:hypothetical protein X474_02770 [Dethiosulfatarculus sandiegensis]